MDVKRLDAMTFDQAFDLPEELTEDYCVDPTSPRQQWMAWRVWLPELELAFPGNRQIVMNKALNMIARHRLPPPDWLANEMLVRFPDKERETVISKETLAAALAAAMALESPDTNALLDIEHKFGVSLTHLKRMMKAERDRLNRLDKAIE